MIYQQSKASGVDTVVKSFSQTSSWQNDKSKGANHSGSEFLMAESNAQYSSQRPMHFVVIVLGDVGRSPRMQYHAVSLLVSGISDESKIE